MRENAGRGSATGSGSLERARAAWDRYAWAEAYERLSAADAEAPLAAEDIERLAMAAYLSGRDSESEELLARAHQSFLEEGAVERAVRCAFWLAHALLSRREQARGGGWLARAQTLLDGVRDDCVERGYLVLPDALRSVSAGDLETAHERFSRAAEVARSFHDPDLAALALSGRGRVLIRMGDAARGADLLDEAMAAVEAGVVSPWVAGDVYCTVIEGCTETFDVRRALDWTGALSRWCEAQPDLVPFRGQCLVRRSEILQLRGAWDQALEEAQQACTRLSEPSPRPAVGLAWYQQAELHRLRGELEQAEAAYRESSRWTRAPRPGMALLRLAQGRVDAATAAIHVLLEAATDRSMRAKILAAAVEIALAGGDVATARTAADELDSVARHFDAPFLNALAAHSMGAVRLAERDAHGALTVLQRAWSLWQELGAPYDAARVRLLIALACRQLGDRDTADMELDTAHAVFRQLGAAPDCARVEALRQRTTPTGSGLTPRELEVLRLVAHGLTNRTIAETLFISERTVHRHVSNIFRKLGLASRTAAAAYAFEHELL